MRRKTRIQGHGERGQEYKDTEKEDKNPRTLRSRKVYKDTVGQGGDAERY